MTQIFIVDAAIWPKFGTFAISIREVIITSILLQFDKKKALFLRGGLDLSSIIWDAIRYGLDVLHQCGKRVKTKSNIV